MDASVLESQLRKRLKIIADHGWRDRYPAAHLQALQDIAEEIQTTQTAMGRQLPPRLRHFLENCSFDKALAFLETTQDSHSAGQ